MHCNGLREPINNVSKRLEIKAIRSSSVKRCFLPKFLLEVFLQIFHAKILMRCRLEATHEAIEGSLRIGLFFSPFSPATTFPSLLPLSLNGVLGN